MAYKFIKTLNPDNQFDLTNVTIELPHNEVGLTDLTEAFEEFLAACGFAKYKFEIVEETEDNE